MTTKEPVDLIKNSADEWFVLCVNPTQEIKIANTLKDMGIQVFYPESNKIRNTIEPTRNTPVPLFKSHILVKISKRNRVIVFKVPGVTRYLFYEGRPAQVSDWEIDAMKRWVEDDMIDELVVSKFSATKTSASIDCSIKDNQAERPEIERKHLKLILKGMDLVLHARLKEIVNQRKYYVK